MVYALLITILMYRIRMRIRCAIIHEKRKVEHETYTQTDDKKRRHRMSWIWITDLKFFPGIVFRTKTPLMNKISSQQLSMRLLVPGREKSASSHQIGLVKQLKQKWLCRANGTLARCVLRTAIYLQVKGDGSDSSRQVAWVGSKCTRIKD